MFSSCGNSTFIISSCNFTISESGAVKFQGLLSTSVTFTPQYLFTQPGFETYLRRNDRINQRIAPSRQHRIIYISRNTEAHLQPMPQNKGAEYCSLIVRVAALSASVLFSTTERKDLYGPFEHRCSQCRLLCWNEDGILLVGKPLRQGFI